MMTDTVAVFHLRVTFIREARVRPNNVGEVTYSNHHSVWT